MTCSLFPDSGDILDQLPLKNICRSQLAPVTVNMEFQVLGFKYSCSIVKNLNCIIVYSDILNYKHVTKYIFVESDNIL